jgi:hypothetical protein
VEAHRSCVTNDDCVIVSDHCRKIPGGFCGQLSINREGAKSEDWKRLEGLLDECGPNSCTMCAVALGPTCAEGSCGSNDL